MYQCIGVVALVLGRPGPLVTELLPARAVRWVVLITPGQWSTIISRARSKVSWIHLSCSYGEVRDLSSLQIPFMFVFITVVKTRVKASRCVFFFDKMIFNNRNNNQNKNTLCFLLTYFDSIPEVVKYIFSIFFFIQLF